jgi:hypothetical protein
VLTEKDIHYLSGLLLLVSTDATVRIDLGVRVTDETIAKPRDVDVVLTTSRGDLEEQLFGGIEVKDHHRKLDVTHVEQLGAKLRDMPSLSERGIVSASGYTAPALKKCDAYGVQPLNLQPFVPAESPLNSVAFPEDFSFTCPMLVPHGPTGLRYISGSKDSFVNPSDVNRPCQWLINGVASPNVSNVGDVNGQILATFHDAIDDDLKEHITRDEATSFNSGLDLKGHDYVLVLDGKEFKIDRVAIAGNFSRRVTHVPAEWLALVRADSEEYIAGAGVAITPDGSLLGIAVTDKRHQPKIIYISYAERTKRIIRNLPLGRSKT